MVPTWRQLACLAGTLLLAVAAWMPWSRDPAGAPVLLYVANETALGPVALANAATIDRWLRESGDVEALRAAERLANDRVEFPAAVDAALHCIRSSPVERALLLTNRSVRAGTLAMRDGNGGWRDSPFAPPAATGDAIRDDHPWIDPSVWRRALAAAAREFPPEHHHFVVVVVSHGNDSLLLTPRLTLEAKRSSPQEVVDLARGAASSRAPVGLRRDELLALLAESRLPIELLLLQSCASASGLRGSDLPANVRAVAAVAGEAPYAALDFTALDADPVASAHRMVESRPEFRVIRRTPAVWRYAWAPLAMALLLAASGWRSARAASITPLREPGGSARPRS